MSALSGPDRRRRDSQTPIRMRPSTRTRSDDPNDTALAPCTQETARQRTTYHESSEKRSRRQRTSTTSAALRTAVPFLPHRSSMPPAPRLPTSPPTVYALVTVPNAASDMSTHEGRPSAAWRSVGARDASQMMDEADELRAAMWKPYWSCEERGQVSAREVGPQEVGSRTALVAIQQTVRPSLRGLLVIVQR